MIRILSLRMLLLALMTVHSLAHSTELPRQMSASELMRAAANLALPSAHRPWTAPAIESRDLGLDIGLEGPFVWRRDTLSYGTQGGVLPRVLPLPRLWLSLDWDSPWQVSLSYSPGTLYGGLGTYGGALQYKFYAVAKHNFSLQTSLTYVDVVRDLSSKQALVALQWSRDMGAWQPYTSLGLQAAWVKAREPAILGDGVADKHYALLRPHVAIGVQLLMPAKLAIQVDLHGKRLAAALLLAQRF